MKDDFTMGFICIRRTIVHNLSILCIAIAVSIAGALDQEAGKLAYREMLLKTKIQSKNGVGDEQGEKYRSVMEINVSQYGDYNIRFSKVPFLDLSDPDISILPFHADDFPLKKKTLNILKDQTNCHSVTGLDDYEVKLDVLELIDNSLYILDYPLHPTSDKNSPYWRDFLHVCKVQVARMRNPNASPSSIGMPLPDIWYGYSLADVAEAVHDEYPNIHQATNIARMLGLGGVLIDISVIPQRSNSQFLRGPIMLADLNTFALRVIAPHSFAVKYAIGRSRPEEIAFAISNGEIPFENLPLDVQQAMSAIDKRFDGGLPTAPQFTAYIEGSPDHPSWPAMHSAASQTSFWMSVVLNLTHDQLCQARLVDYSVAYARTVAGVHFPSDNLDGLNLGQEVLASLLADHLWNTYGSQRSLVQDKIEKMRFDWNTFDPSDPCPYTSK